MPSTNPGFARSLLNVMADGGRVAGGGGIVTGHPTAFLTRPLPDDLPDHRLGGEQSNTSIAFGNVLMLKQFRRLLSGMNPEEELTRFLTERTSFAHTPRLLGSLDLRSPVGRTGHPGGGHELVNGREDGWSWMLAELRALATRVADSYRRPSAAPMPWRRFVAWASEPVSSTWPWPATRLTRLRAGAHHASGSPALVGGRGASDRGRPRRPRRDLAHRGSRRPALRWLA